MWFLLLPLATELPAAAAASELVVSDHHVMSMPGGLDRTQVLYSNSPELVLSDGILVSTLSPSGKAVPSAHLDHTFKGRFDVFTHHVTRNVGRTDKLYVACLLRNVSDKPATVRVLQAGSYLTNPDAPFYRLPPLEENPYGRIFAGPGDRLTDTFLRGWTQKGWPSSLDIPPGQSRLLFNHLIPLRDLKGTSNARSTLVRLQTSEPLQGAVMAMHGNSPPPLSRWQFLADRGRLAGPRDKPPTKPGTTVKPIYGRVAGVSEGSKWTATFTDNPYGSLRLTLPQDGSTYSWVISTLDQGAFGTMQQQSAPLLKRYPDTSYRVHGNYAVEYNFFLPLFNSLDEPRTVQLFIQTPLKSNKSKNGLGFLNPPGNKVWFRGTVRIRFRDESGVQQARYMHLVQRLGDYGQPLATVTLQCQETKMVAVDFLYPPDCTPPQVLTVRTVAPEGVE